MHRTHQYRPCRRVLAPGAIVVRPDRLYDHYGVYIGDGLVIEFAGKDTGTPTVRMVLLRDFARGRQVLVKPYRGESVLPNAEVVRRALSQLGRADYSAFNYNCEHFANWCKIGRAESHQVNGALGLALAGVAVACLAHA